MEMIKNVVFDVGNVFVRWSPPEIVRRCFDLAPDSSESLARAEALFRGATWRRLNLGEMTQAEAEAIFQADLGLTAEQTRQVFFHVMDHQELIEGTEAIARRLKQAGYRVFGLTDNVHEIVRHYKGRYRFWELFDGAVVSAEVGLMKPDPAIFHHLLRTFGLVAAETVFFDDYQANIDGAASVGIHARLFTTPIRCEDDLKALIPGF
jgi:putative hydrolase of the HAD superfamily